MLSWQDPTRIRFVLYPGSGPRYDPEYYSSKCFFDVFWWEKTGIEHVSARCNVYKISQNKSSYHDHTKPAQLIIEHMVAHGSGAYMILYWVSLKNTTGMIAH